MSKIFTSLRAWTLLSAALVAGLVVVAVLFASTGRDLRTSEQHLSDTNATLADERAAHRETEARLSAASESLADGERAQRTLESEITFLQDSVVAQRQQNDALAQDVSRLGDEGAALVEQVAGLQGHVEALTAQNTQVEASVLTLEGERTNLEADNDTLNEANAQLNTQLGELADERDELQQFNGLIASQKASVERLNRLLEHERDSLGNEVEAFRGAHTSIAELETQIAELEASIKDLVAAREPLILKTFEANPTCTGSMEPKVTCLDTALMLKNFRSEDIVAGTVIIFWDPEEGEGGGTILHRVMEVKVEAGAHHFWPKGDAVDEPDGYWVPEELVVGYMIGLQEDTRMVNADLRETVNDAKAALRSTQSQMLEARQHYRDTATKHCGTSEVGDPCQGSQSDFDKVDQAYNAFIADHNDYTDAYCANNYAQYRARL